MTLLWKIIFLTCVHTYHCNTEINNLFNKINEKTLKFNQISAEIAWDSSIDPGNTNLSNKAANYQKNWIIWQQTTCDKLATLFTSHLLNSTQERQTYLLCRGPKYTFQEARETSNLYKDLQDVYNVEICLPSKRNISDNDLTGKEHLILDYLSKFKENIEIFYRHSKTKSKVTNEQIIESAVKLTAVSSNASGSNFCLKGEADFDQLMASSKEEVLQWLWLVWREKTGPLMREPYKRLVDIENVAAKRNGYQNIGASWRDDLEIPNLRSFCRQLYKNIRPLYASLHGIVRFHLRRLYGDVVSETGPIPAHLLGNLWSQNWEQLSNLLIKGDINLDKNIRNLNWTVTHMVKRAEDYYQSLGLPAMTDAFWRESVFVRENNAAKCHGAAADMFKDDNFRLLYCSETTKEDFYVLHHELGHIQYYMAYETQPALFRQANTALHETIGDTIMYGVMAPQHLHRLGLITDNQLYTTNTKDNLIYNDDEEQLKSIEVEFDPKFKDKFVFGMKIDPIDESTKEQSNFRDDELVTNLKNLEFGKHSNPNVNTREKSVENVSNKQMNSRKNNLDSNYKNEFKFGRVVHPKDVDDMNLDSILSQSYRKAHNNRRLKYVPRNEFQMIPNLKRASQMTEDAYNFKIFNGNSKRFHTYDNLFETNLDSKFERRNPFQTMNLNFQTELNSYNKIHSTNIPNLDIKMELNTDEILLMKQALNKIPQIPFSLLIDEYRWKYFEGSLQNPNADFWKLSLELQGIAPPGIRGEEYFDAGAKFHVPDNTPYIRYFLSGFLQHQLFEALCKSAVYGRRNVKESLPDTIPLHRCDLYGSKSVGKVLKDIMSKGHSQHWKEILKSTVNISDITSAALERYYRPLQRLLLEHIEKYNIPIGW